jgi:uncharacterized LabA/DUF88 family protein
MNGGDNVKEVQLRPVRVYVDGFNLYHAIESLRRPDLKWLNMKALATSFLKPGERLDRVTFFTAVLNWDREKQQRHRNYIAALEAVGVTVVTSSFKKGNRYCWQHQRYCANREEKQTDVAISTSLIVDAYDGAFKRAVLVSADSDHIPAADIIKARFPELRLTMAAPPGRLQEARDLGQRVSERIEIKPERLAACKLPMNVFNAAGKKVASIPALYLEGQVRN